MPPNNPVPFNSSQTQPPLGSFPRLRLSRLRGAPPCMLPCSLLDGGSHANPFTMAQIPAPEGPFPALGPQPDSWSRLHLAHLGITLGLPAALDCELPVGRSGVLAATPYSPSPPQAWDLGESRGTETPPLAPPPSLRGAPNAWGHPERRCPRSRPLCCKCGRQAVVRKGSQR